MDANLDKIDGNDDYQRKEVKKIAKKIKDVKFTTGYIWTLSEKGHVTQYPIIKEIEKGEVVGCKLGKERQVEPLRGSTQIATGSTL